MTTEVTAPVVTEPVAPVVPAEPEKVAPAEKTYTQAEWNAAQATTRLELKAGKEASAKLATIEAANLTAQELAEKRATDAEARAQAAEDKATAAELSAHKAAIGAELGIPASLRSRLSGTTEEEIRADAVAVAADLKLAAPKVPVGGPTNPGGKEEKTAAELEAMPMSEYAAYEAAKK